MYRLLLLSLLVACTKIPDDTSADTGGDPAADAGDLDADGSTDADGISDADADADGAADTDADGTADTDADGTADADDGSATPCAELDPDTCATDDRCVVISGLSPVDVDGVECIDHTLPGTPVGCMDSDYTCDDAETYAMNPAGGDCMWFPDTCVPEGWTGCSIEGDICPSTDDDDGSADADDGGGDTEILPIELVACGASAEVDLEDLSFDGDILELDVSYSGGCGDHTFQMCWNDVVLPDFIPEVHFKFSHYTDGDPCESIVSKTVRFDLSTVIPSAGDLFNVKVMTPWEELFALYGSTDADADADADVDGGHTDADADGASLDPDGDADADADGVAVDPDDDADADGVPVDPDDDADADGVPVDPDDGADADADGVPVDPDDYADADGVPVDPDDGADADADEGGGEHDLLPIELVECGPSDDVTLHALSYDEDILELDVSHSGGCGEHSYQMCWDSVVLPYFIPEVHFKFSHENHGDFCEAIVSETLRFDLSSVTAVAGDMFNVKVMTPWDDLYAVYDSGGAGSAE